MPELKEFRRRVLSWEETGHIGEDLFAVASGECRRKTGKDIDIVHDKSLSR